MEWILLSVFGTAALLLIELREFIGDPSVRRPGIRPNSLPAAQSALAPSASSAPSGAWQPGNRFAAQGPRVTCRWLALDEAPAVGTHRRETAQAAGIGKTGWQMAARHLANHWTVLDGVFSHHGAGCDDSATGECAIRRTLSPDQILSARIDAAYAVWATARSLNRMPPSAGEHRGRDPKFKAKER